MKLNFVKLRSTMASITQFAPFFRVTLFSKSNLSLLLPTCLPEEVKNLYMFKNTYINLGTKLWESKELFENRAISTLSSDEGCSVPLSIAEGSNVTPVYTGTSDDHYKKSYFKGNSFNPPCEDVRVVEEDDKQDQIVVFNKTMEQIEKVESDSMARVTNDISVDKISHMFDRQVDDYDSLVRHYLRLQYLLRNLTQIYPMEFPEELNTVLLHKYDKIKAIRNKIALAQIEERYINSYTETIDDYLKQIQSRTMKSGMLDTSIPMNALGEDDEEDKVEGVTLIS